MKIAFDIGANHGGFTDFFLKSFDRVVAVEANPSLAQELFEKYYSDSRVIVVPKAVSNVSNKMIPFWVCNEDGISSALEEWTTKCRFSYDEHNKWVKTEVPTVTIDDLVKEYGAPNHIKLDVEGYEHIALQGMNIPYCPIRFEWEEENLDKLEQSLKHLYSIGYRYFGTVTEVEGEFGFSHDQRPPAFHDSVKSFMDGTRVLLKWSHDYVQKLPKDVQSTHKNFDILEDKKMIFWGMVWCFREIDAKLMKFKKEG